MWGCGHQWVWLLCCSSYSVPAASRYFCGVEWEQEQQGKNSNMEAREWIHSSHFFVLQFAFSIDHVGVVCILYLKVYGFPHTRHHFVGQWNGSNVHADPLLVPYQQY